MISVVMITLTIWRKNKFNVMQLIYVVKADFVVAVCDSV